MIRKLTKKEISNILIVINDAAAKYKGIIPNECWHEPYMSQQELTSQLEDGIKMFGYIKNDELIGVMGIQELQDVTLIRHAYTLTSYHRKGVGKSLLKYILSISQSNSLLVGTWREALWAVQFYKKFGFILQTKKNTLYLLQKYWKISFIQINNSVVLKKFK